MKYRIKNTKVEEKADKCLCGADPVMDTIIVATGYRYVVRCAICPPRINATKMEITKQEAIYAWNHRNDSI
jgi:transcription elongation factor Elf1